LANIFTGNVKAYLSAPSSGAPLLLIILGLPGTSIVKDLIIDKEKKFKNMDTRPRSPSGFQSPSLSTPLASSTSRSRVLWTPSILQLLDQDVTILRLSPASSPAAETPLMDTI